MDIIATILLTSSTNDQQSIYLDSEISKRENNCKFKHFVKLLQNHIIVNNTYKTGKCQNTVHFFYRSIIIGCRSQIPQNAVLLQNQIDQLVNKFNSGGNARCTAVELSYNNASKQ